MSLSGNPTRINKSFTSSSLFHPCASVSRIRTSIPIFSTTDARYPSPTGGKGFMSRPDLKVYAGAVSNSIFLIFISLSFFLFFYKLIERFTKCKILFIVYIGCFQLREFQESRIPAHPVVVFLEIFDGVYVEAGIIFINVRHVLRRDHNVRVMIYGFPVMAVKPCLVPVNPENGVEAFTEACEISIHRRVERGRFYEWACNMSLHKGFAACKL